MRSVWERMWEQARKIFLRRLVEKEEAAKMGREQEASEHIIAPKQRRSMLSFFPRRRRQRRGHRPVVGTAPATEHNH